MREKPVFDFVAMLQLLYAALGCLAVAALAVAVVVFVALKVSERREARYLRQHIDLELLLSERRHGEIAAAARALRAQSQRLGRIGQRPQLQSIKGGKSDPKGRQG